MLFPDVARARLLAVVGIVALIPLQYAITDLAEQEPYPGLFLPGFATGQHEAPIEVWIPRATVIDSDGTRRTIDPYDGLLHGFPSSPTSALTNWFRAGLDADGEVLPCARRPHDPSVGNLQRRCDGYTRSGDVALLKDETISYVRRQVEALVPNPERLILTWSTAYFELGSTEPLRSEQRLRLEVEFR